MTRTVILIRHAKSDWGDHDTDDHDRVLNKRGRASAPLIGQWLADHALIPDEMLVSDAARTRETAGLISANWDQDVPVSYHHELYLSSPDAMLEALQKSKALCLAIVAHNPGIALLARGLVAELPNHPQFRDYPTAATSVITFEGPIEPGQGTCTHFVTPKELG